MDVLNSAERFALECVRCDSDAEIGSSLGEFFSQYREIDWNSLFGYGDKMLPFISTVIEKHGSSIPIPRRMVSLLRLQHVSTLQKNRGAIEEIKVIARMFHSHGIPLIFLKGSALLFTVYRDDPGLRKMEDIDALLVNQGDLSGAEILLKQMGFEEASGKRYYGFDYPPREWWKERHCHLVYFKGALRFELHWKADLVSGRPLLEKLLESSGKMDLNGTELQMLSPEGNLLVACTNYIKDFTDYRRDLADLHPRERNSRSFYYRLFYLCEIKKMLQHYRSDLSRENLCGLIHASKYGYGINTLLLLAKQIVRAPIPETLIADMKADRLIRGFVFFQRGCSFDQFRKLFMLRDVMTFLNDPVPAVRKGLYGVTCAVRTFISKILMILAKR